MPAFFALEEEEIWVPMLEAASIFLFLDFDGTRLSDVYLSPRSFRDSIWHRSVITLPFLLTKSLAIRSKP